MAQKVPSCEAGPRLFMAKYIRRERKVRIMVKKIAELEDGLKGPIISRNDDITLLRAKKRELLKTNPV